MIEQCQEQIPVGRYGYVAGNAKPLGYDERTETGRERETGIVGCTSLRMGTISHARDCDERDGAGSAERA